MIPKPTRLITRMAFRPTRCLTTSAARPMATPTNQYPPNDARGGTPVEDIDVVFDYPSEGQSSHQKQTLERSGLDVHQFLSHHNPTVREAAQAGMRAAGKSVPGARMDKGMKAAESHNMLYFGIGALGLGGLYMMMRPPRAEPGTKAHLGSSLQPGDLAAQQATEAKFRSGRAS